MRTILALGLTLLLVAPASANPISTQVVRLRQVPKTTHVQVTYGSMYKDVPQELKRDGTPLTVSWTALSAFTANTGSGLVSLAAQQFCDCNVAVGSHKYEVKFTAGSMGSTLSGSIEVVKDYALPTPKDAGVGKDMMPWDIPEPTPLQGLDCTTKCTGVSTDGPVAKLDGPQAKTDGPQVKPDSPQSTPDSATPPVKPSESDSGCSLAGRPLDDGGLLLLAAGLLLAALLFRRRG